MKKVGGGERGRHHPLNFQFWRPHVDGGGVKFFPRGGYRHTLNRLTFNNYDTTCTYHKYMLYLQQHH